MEFGDRAYIPALCFISRVEKIFIFAPIHTEFGENEKFFKLLYFPAPLLILPPTPLASAAILVNG